MNNLVKVIGEIVLTILIIAIPMLTAFSIGLDWSVDIEWILILLTVVDIVSVGAEKISDFLEKHTIDDLLEVVKYCVRLKEIEYENSINSLKEK